MYNEARLAHHRPRNHPVMVILEYTFLLDHMDRRNIVRFAFWLTSLTANQKIFLTIEKAFERDFSKRMGDKDIHFYKAGDDLASCRTVLEGIIHNGNTILFRHESLIYDHASEDELTQIP